MVLRKKSRTKFFERIMRGDKTVEIRLADFEELKRKKFPIMLEEWDPHRKTYTGRKLRVTAKVLSLTDVLSLYSVKDLTRHRLAVLQYEKPKKVKRLG